MSIKDIAKELQEAGIQVSETDLLDEGTGINGVFSANTNEQDEKEYEEDLESSYYEFKNEVLENLDDLDEEGIRDALNIIKDITEQLEENDELFEDIDDLVSILGKKVSELQEGRLIIRRTARGVKRTRTNKTKAQAHREYLMRLRKTGGKAAQRRRMKKYRKSAKGRMTAKKRERRWGDFYKKQRQDQEESFIGKLQNVLVEGVAGDEKQAEIINTIGNIFDILSEVFDDRRVDQIMKESWDYLKGNLIEDTNSEEFANLLKQPVLLIQEMVRELEKN